MKRKIIIVFVLIIAILFGSGITYSIFRSNTSGSVNQKIAKFVFEAKEVDELNIPLADMYPGVTKDYSFSVTNKQDSKISNVTLNYQIIIKTYHFMPTVIELKKVDGKEETLILTCDESFTRNSNNELVCNSQVLEMSHNIESLDNYKLVVKFPESYNDEMYKDVVDYIDIAIKSSLLELFLILKLIFSPFQ